MNAGPKAKMYRIPQISISIITENKEFPEDNIVNIPSIRMKAKARPNASVAKIRSFISLLEKCQNETSCLVTGCWKYKLSMKALKISTTGEFFWFC